MLQIIGTLLVVVASVISITLMAMAVTSTDFYMNLRNKFKAKPLASAKDTTPSIVKLRRKQAEILQKTQARAIAERNAELALNLEYRKMVWAEKQANLQAALAKR